MASLAILKRADRLTVRFPARILALPLESDPTHKLFYYGSILAISSHCNATKVAKDFPKQPAPENGFGSASGPLSGTAGYSSKFGT